MTTVVSDLAPPATWPAYDRLAQSLWNIWFGLSHTISTFDLINECRKAGGTVDYFSGNPPDSRFVIEVRDDSPLWSRNRKHELRTYIELMGDQYLPLVTKNVPIALGALDTLSPETQADLDAYSSERRWIHGTRGCLNELAGPLYYPGHGQLGGRAGFPRTVSEAIWICKDYRLSFEGWRDTLRQISERLAQLKACRPVQPAAEQQQDEPVAATTPKAGKKPTANDVMMAELAANLDLVKGWTIAQWSKHTGYARSTICDCPTWKSLELLRKSTKAELAIDRSRRSKPGNRRQ